MDEHSHRCGDLSLERGCGHVWEHTCGKRDNHMCPACGKGPWMIRVDPKTLDQDLGQELPNLDHCEGKALTHFMHAIVAYSLMEEIRERLSGSRK